MTLSDAGTCLRQPSASRAHARLLKPAATLATLVVALGNAACSRDVRTVTPAASLLTIATPADADALLPPLVMSTQGKQAADLLFDVLAQPVAPLETVGDKGFRPQLARSWQWSADSLSIAFQLDPSARWHDGTPVRARDVQFSYELYVDSAVASPHAGAFHGIDSISVRDSLTAVVWWASRHPEQFFQVAYNLSVMPAHLLADVPRDGLATSMFARQPVGSGRYRFEAWTPRRDLVLVADSTNYRGAPGYARVVWTIAADPEAAALRVLAGQADVLESVKGDAYHRAREASDVQTVSYGSLDYAFLAFNVAGRAGATRDLFRDRAMRVALTRAVNRTAVVANALDSLGAVALGPFTRADPVADTSLRQIAHDVAQSRTELDALGWRQDASAGTRYKGGRPLRFEVLVPSTSAPRMRIATLLQAQFAAIGVQVDIQPLDPASFFARMQSGDFDAALNMWHADPSPVAIRGVWGSPRGKDVGGNFGRYSNREVDALLDSAAHTFDAAARRALVRHAHQAIVDDAPAIWLYEPRNVAVINRRVRPVELRADAWWARLSDWTPAAPTLSMRHP